MSTKDRALVAATDLVAGECAYVDEEKRRAYLAEPGHEICHGFATRDFRVADVVSLVWTWPPRERCPSLRIR